MGEKVIIAWGVGGGRREDAATTVQRAFRCYSARVVYYMLLGAEPGEDDWMEDWDERGQRSSAASVIQQAFRGYRARNALYALSDALGDPSARLGPEAEAAPCAVTPRVLRVWRQVHAGADPWLQSELVQADEQDGDRQPREWSAEAAPEAAGTRAAGCGKGDTEKAWEEGGEEQVEEIELQDMGSQLFATGRHGEAAGEAAEDGRVAEEIEEGEVVGDAQAWGEKAGEDGDESVGTGAAALARERTRHISDRRPKSKVVVSRPFVPWR